MPVSDHRVLHGAIALLVLLVVAVDFSFLPLGVPAWSLYLIPLMLCLFTSRPSAPLVVAGATSVLNLAGLFLKSMPLEGEVLRTAQVNRILGFVTICAIGLMIRRAVLATLMTAEQRWVENGQNRLVARMQGEQRPEELGRNILSFLAEYANAQVGAAYLRHDSGEMVRCGGFAGDSESSPRDVVRPGEGLVGQASRDGKLIIAHDVPAGYLDVRSGLGAAPPRALAVVPTTADGAVVGVIELGFFTAPAREVRRFLDSIAESMGAALRAARYRESQAELLEETRQQAAELQRQRVQMQTAYDELQATNEELHVANNSLDEQSQVQAELMAKLERLSKEEARLHRRFQSLDDASLTLSRALARLDTAPVDGVLQAIADQARVVAGAEFAALGIGNDPERPFHPWVFSGLGAEQAAQVAGHPRPQGLLGNAVRTGRPFRCRDLPAHPEFGGFPAGHPGMRSFLSVGIRFGDRVLGVLYFTNKQSAEEFSEEDERTVELFAERAGVAMEIARLSQTVRSTAAELERASRYKSEFLANMSHELRTPLNSTLILAKLLIDNKGGNLTPEQVKYAQSISSAGNDLLALINDILDLSKIEAGKIQLNEEPVAVARIANELRRRFDPLTMEKNLQFSVTVHPSGPDTIHTDPLRLQQILTNLLSNAVKFTERGSIKLHVETEGSRRIAFTVEDTGAGIPAEQHEVIFEAFRQADGTTARRYGGTGLGLSISRELARLLGGEIRLRSAPGEGSAFTVILPLRAEASAPARPAPPPRPPEAAKPLVPDDRERLADPRRVVLFVEDDPTFAQILFDLAHELGFQCLIARSADEGLRLARQLQPVAVFLDIGLPDQSGLTVIELLKRDPSTRHLPIHVVSGHDYQQVAREMGVVGYVLKPAKREQLVAAFRSLEERLSRKVKSLLVVEDDAVQRQAITKLLEDDDVGVAGAATAAEALSQLRSARFDCVVLDLMLPDVSGFELLEQMSGEAAFSSLPVVVYTARALSLDEEQQLRRLSRSIIVKGARSPERLLEEVTLFLHQAEGDLAPEKQRMLRAVRDGKVPFHGRRILLVEDDVRNVFALTSLLEAEGAAIDIARNGKEALSRLDQGPPFDVVLMDVMMPEMDGLQATREIRKNAQWASLPIVALTAKAMPDDRQHCLAAGANDYIAKPIDTERLLSLLRVWMPR